jgi:hypothetical protein
VSKNILTAQKKEIIRGDLPLDNILSWCPNTASQLYEEPDSHPLHPHLQFISNLKKLMKIELEKTK